MCYLRYNGAKRVICMLEIFLTPLLYLLAPETDLKLYVRTTRVFFGVVTIRISKRVMYFAKRC
jgi:hypothetical protein